MLMLSFGLELPYLVCSMCVLPSKNILVFKSINTESTPLVTELLKFIILIQLRESHIKKAIRI